MMAGRGTVASPGRGAILVHAAFPIGVLAVGALIGSASAPGPWYSSLEKPWFTPPGWVFGPVWTVLYLLIGWVGARKWLSGGHRALWALQMALNFAWSPVFFGLQRPRAALAIIVGLLVTIALFIFGEWRRDPLSARLFLPYAAWVSLATCLNVGIVVLN
jgi:benzodiazapine receptor